MSLRKSLSLALLLVCFAPEAARAAAPAYSAIYVFGDSYCDVGNLYAATGGLVPTSPPYYMGHFSNGPLWVEHVASSLGLPMKPALLGGTDYAFGGAEATAAVPTPFGAIPSVTEQVALYLSQHGHKADPNALYILEGGGNDIINANGTGSAEDLGFKIAIAIAESELMLRQAGARKFVVPNLFDLALVPATVGNKAFATTASLSANTHLAALLGYESGIHGLTLQRLDVYTLMNGIVKDTNHFGFTNVTTQCLNTTTGQVCADPDHTLFWDDVHPTVFGHAFFAVTLEVQLPR